MSSSRTTFNWGHALTGAFVLFMAYILYFVYQSFQNEIDLVSEDYYAREVAFQQRIEAIKNAATWDGEANVRLTSNAVSIELSSVGNRGPFTGSIHFFRPSNAALDIQRPLQLDQQGIMSVPLEVLAAGRYEVQIEWKAGDRHYYATHDLFIP